MDHILHFTISFALAWFAMLIFSVNIPKLRHSAPRFWQSESSIRRWFLTIVFALSAIIAITIGVAKEWLDGLGFGNVEISDLIADLAGVWLGAYLVLGQIRSHSAVRRVVTYRSESSFKKIDRIAHISSNEDNDSTRNEQAE